MAAAQGRSIGSVLSEFARRGLNTPTLIDANPGSFPTFHFEEPGRPITSEMVRAALDES